MGTGRGKPKARVGGVSGLNVSIYTCTNACIRGVAWGGRWAGNRKTTVHGNVGNVNIASNATTSYVSGSRFSGMASQLPQ